MYEYCYCNYICMRELLSYISYYLSCTLLFDLCNLCLRYKLYSFLYNNYLFLLQKLNNYWIFCQGGPGPPLDPPLPFASAFILEQGSRKVWRLLTQFHGLQECNQSICHMISPYLGSATVTTSLFGEFAICKVQIKEYGASYSVVLQLFKFEATRLGLAGSTDLRTPVPQRNLSFVYLTFNILRSCRKLG